MTNEKGLDSTVAIIGAGFSGIGVGAQLQRKLSFTDYVVFEKEDNVGGTWLVNKYPGVACDVPSHFYSYSFERNPNWSRMFPPGSEIHAYLCMTAVKYGVIDRTRLRSVITSAVYEEPTSTWLLQVTNLNTRQSYPHRCKVLFMAIGVLTVPQDCDIPGRKAFKGRILHTARWDESVSTENSDVVVIGNGCSGSQVVGALAFHNRARSIRHFVRSRHYYVTRRANTPFPRLWILACRLIPGFTRLVRAIIFWIMETNWLFFRVNQLGNLVRAFKERQALRYMKKWTPPEYLPLLLPNFALGCKRRIFDPDYLKALHCSHVQLTDDPITHILPEGVLTVSGRTYPSDLIILANGFKLIAGLYDIDIRGAGGVSLQEHWASFGGPEAYNGTAVSHMPNMFLLYGPNISTSHTSVVYAIENQIAYALTLLRPLLCGHIDRLAVRDSAEVQYSDMIQYYSGQTVFTKGGCSSVGL